MRACVSEKHACGSSVNLSASEWARPIKMPLRDHLLVERPPGWLGTERRRRRRRRGEERTVKDSYAID